MRIECVDVPVDRERRSRRSARTSSNASSTSTSSTQGDSSDAKSPKSPTARKVPESIDIVGAARSARSSIRKRRKNEAKTPTGSSGSSSSSDALRRTAVYNHMAQTHQENSPYLFHHTPYSFSPDTFLGDTSDHGIQENPKVPHILSQHEPGVLPDFAPSPFHNVINGSSLHSALSAQDQKHSSSDNIHTHLPTSDNSGGSAEFSYPMPMSHTGHQEFSNSNSNSNFHEPIFYTGDGSLSSSMNSTHGHPVPYNSHSLPASVSANSLYHRAYSGTGDIDHRISCSYDSGIANTSNENSPMFPDGASLSHMSEMRRLRHMVDEQQIELNNRRAMSSTPTDTLGIEQLAEHFRQTAESAATGGSDGIALVESGIATLLQHGFIQSRMPMALASIQDDRILFANNAFCQLFGISQSECSIYSWRNLMRTSEMDTWPTIDNSQRRSYSILGHIVNMDTQQPFAVLTHVDNIHDDTGQPVFALLFVHKVSEGDRNHSGLDGEELSRSSHPHFNFSDIVRRDDSHNHSNEMNSRGHDDNSRILDNSSLNTELVRTSGLMQIHGQDVTPDLFPFVTEMDDMDSGSEHIDSESVNEFMGSDSISDPFEFE